jgi:hypothetical protein
LNLVDQFGDGGMRVFGALNLVVTGRYSLMLLRPRHLVLRSVVVMEHRDHVVEIPPDKSGSLCVARRYGPDQAREVAKLGAKGTVDNRHLKRVTWHA